MEVRIVPPRTATREISAVHRSWYDSLGGNKEDTRMKDLFRRQETGADIEARNREELTPLMWAAVHNPNPEEITALLKAGADVKARDQGGATALMIAVMINQNPDVIRALVEAGADLEAPDKAGGTPLILAARSTRTLR